MFKEIIYNPLLLKRKLFLFSMVKILLENVMIDGYFLLLSLKCKSFILLAIMDVNLIYSIYINPFYIIILEV